MENGPGNIVMTHASCAIDEESRAENTRSVKLLVKCLSLEAVILVIEDLVLGLFQSGGLLLLWHDDIQSPLDVIKLGFKECSDRWRKRVRARRSRSLRRRYQLLDGHHEVGCMDVNLGRINEKLLL